MSTTHELKRLFGLSPQSETLSEFLKSISPSSGLRVPEVKSYPDAVYFNYHQLGLSLLFKPVQGYKPKMGLSRNDLEEGKLTVDGIDLYNTPSQQSSGEKSRKKATFTFSTYPISPIILKLEAEIKDRDGKVIPRPEQFVVQRETQGKAFVEYLGEPDRKGGGSGPSSGSIGIWCEWLKDGILVEFGGAEARGPQAWETGKDAVWKVITLFVA
ncbi:hypothetical protein E1B28_000932 [Marasmius oreades]|uniref:Uncharacterized protein n=1 Tax=Marasmius oreades TaxID=181124 RepID=A0A9P8AEV8_9AGAR|nr:uncharacterized protein E1B28_000932 [Marasmius oreades]KAG7099057.1 hypothetical protein E1B28_000932 [Marasmius oreades]